MRKNISVGDLVTLDMTDRYAGLRAGFLTENGYQSGMWLIIREVLYSTPLNGTYWKVAFPNGYEFDICSRDIVNHRPGNSINQ